MFCPNYKGPVGVLSGGSVFLVIVLVGVTGYLFVGVVIVQMVMRNKIEIPNQGFCTEVKESLLAAVGFILSCGKKKEGSEKEIDGKLL
jgi:hypothetical protein